MAAPENIHATCVQIEGRGVLLIGPSGSGKSDLALRLMDQGAALVADDQVFLSAEEGRLIARTPEAIAGQIEARSLGLLTVPYLSETEIFCLIELAPLSEALERLPEARRCTLCGIAIPCYRIHGLAASAPTLIRRLMVVA